MSNENPVNTDANATQTPANSVPARPSYGPNWLEIVGGVARDLGKIDIDKVNVALSTVIGEPDEEDKVAFWLTDPELVPDEVFRKFACEVRPGVPSAVVNNALINVRKKNPKTLATAQPNNSPQSNVSQPPQYAPSPVVAGRFGLGAIGSVLNTSIDVLPRTNSRSYLGSVNIKISTDVSSDSIEAAVQALVADTVGFFSVLETVQKQLGLKYKKANKTGDALYYELDEILTKKENAPIQKLLGVPVAQRYTSKKEKNEFINRLRTILMPEIKSLTEELLRWYNEFRDERKADVGAMMSGIESDTIPDMTNLLARVNSLPGTLNATFDLHGVPCAVALKFEADTIDQTLKDSRLLSKFGVTDSNMLLEELGIGSNDKMVALERNLSRFITALFEMNKQATDETSQAQYFVALAKLAKSVISDFDKFVGSSTYGNPKSQVDDENNLASRLSPTSGGKSSVLRDGSPDTSTKSTSRGYNVR